MKASRIIVVPVFPPIPTRNFDYCAIDDDTYDIGQPAGYGPTEEAAIADLLEQIEERVS